MMRTRLFTVLLAAACGLATGVRAQTEEEPVPMMGGGMMGMHGGTMGEGMMEGGMGMHGAMGAGMGMKHHGYGMLLAMASQLGLSQEQIRQLREAHYPAQREAIQQRAKLQMAELDLRQLMNADPVDEVKVKSQIRSVFELRAEMAVAAFDTWQKARQVLTLEQRQQLKGMVCPVCGMVHGAKGGGGKR
ncbi:MAG: periplasmic heavy metal sensor [Candidatus Latescibacterota bacterium]